MSTHIIILLKLWAGLVFDCLLHELLSAIQSDCCNTMEQAGWEIKHLTRQYWSNTIGTYGIQKSSWWTWKNIDLFTEKFIKMLSYLWWYLLPSLPLVWPLPLIDKGESRLHSTKCLVNIFSQDKSALHCCRLKPGCPQADFCWWVVTHFFSLILHLSWGRFVQVGEHEIYGWENLNKCIQVLPPGKTSFISFIEVTKPG